MYRRQAIDVANLAIDDERPVEAAEVGDGKRPQAVESSAEDRLQCADVKATEHQRIEYPVNPVTVVHILYTHVCTCVHTYICVHVCTYYTSTGY